MPKVEMKFALGSKVRDVVTGVTGVAVAFTTWKNGCSRFAIQQPADKDGKVAEPHWADDQDVELVEEPKAAKPAKKTGGPQNDPAMGMRGA